MRPHRLEDTPPQAQYTAFSAFRKPRGTPLYQEPGGWRFPLSSSTPGGSVLPALAPVYWKGYYDHYHAVCEKGKKLRARWKEQGKGFEFLVCRQVGA